MLCAITRSGLYGLLLHLIFAYVYLSAMWNTLRHRPQRVLERAVTGLYIVAVSVWLSVYNMLHALASSQGASWQSSFLWWGAYLQWRLSLMLLLLWPPVVLLALALRPRGVPIKNPGCMPGAISALLGTMLFHLYFLAVFFGASYRASNEDRIMNEMNLRSRIKALQKEIQTQNQASQAIVAPAPLPGR